ncbi:MAG: DUF1850 domain-containing protein [Thermodesulfobacteriota bacterium]
MLKKTWKCLLPIFFLAVFFYPVLILEVRTGRSDQILFCKRISPGDRFEFHYIHSVDRTPVSGQFLITSKGMVKPIETQFLSYGPGLPSMEGKVIVEKGLMKARPEVEEMKQFSFFVSPFTNQYLECKGQRLDFSKMREGEVIIVEVKQYPIGGLIFKDGRK